MKFHLPSFVLGCAAGYAAKSVSGHLRPLALELASVAYKVADAVATRLVRRKEDLEDLLAEARARVKRAPTAPAPVAH